MFFPTRMSRHLLSTALLGILVFGVANFFPSRAIAADAGPDEQPPEPPFDQARFENAPERNWSLIVGVGGSYKPEYEGSDKFELNPVPVVVFTYGEWLDITPKAVTVTALRHGGFALSGRVGYESGRDEDDGERLRGLGEIDFAATFGAKASYSWEGLELYASLDQTINGSESLIGTFGADFKAPVTERLILGAAVEATIANDKHMEAYFGVNSTQSLASGLSEYKAEAGLKRVDLSASATYMLTKNWLVRGEAGVGFLTGDAANSPIVEKKVQPSASLFVGYKF